MEAAGDLALRYRIDADDQVNEWDETNNEKAFRITVLHPDKLSDLVVTDIWQDQGQIWC